MQSFQISLKHGELQEPTPGTNPELDSQVTLKLAMEPISTPSRAMTRVRSEDKNKVVRMFGKVPNL